MSNVKILCEKNSSPHNPGRGTSWNKEVGGLDLTSSLKAKFGARSGQVHQIRGKFWEVLSPQDAKVGKKSQFCSHIWNSEGKIWGICDLYFWRQNLGLQQEFQRQILGPSPSDLQIWKYPPGPHKALQNPGIIQPDAMIDYSYKNLWKINDSSWNLSLSLRYPQNLSPSFHVRLLGKIILIGARWTIWNEALL